MYLHKCSMSISYHDQCNLGETTNNSKVNSPRFTYLFDKQSDVWKPGDNTRWNQWEQNRVKILLVLSHDVFAKVIFMINETYLRNILVDLVNRRRAGYTWRKLVRKSYSMWGYVTFEFWMLCGWTFCWHLLIASWRRLSGCLSTIQNFYYPLCDYNRSFGFENMWYLRFENFGDCINRVTVIFINGLYCCLWFLSNLLIPIEENKYKSYLKFQNPFI